MNCLCRHPSHIPQTRRSQSIYCSNLSAPTIWPTLHEDVVDSDVDGVIEEGVAEALAVEVARTKRRNGECSSKLALKT